MAVHATDCLRLVLGQLHEAGRMTEPVRKAAVELAGDWLDDLAAALEDTLGLEALIVNDSVILEVSKGLFDDGKHGIWADQEQLYGDIEEALVTAFTRRLEHTPRAEAKAEHTGTMIALILDEEDAEALVENPKDLHVTLVYFEDPPQEELERVVQSFASETAPIVGRVNGGGRFEEQEDGVPVYVNFDSPGLGELRTRLVELLEAAGLEYAKDHGFTPHITLGYDIDLPDVPSLDLVFDQLWVARGDDRKAFQLGSVEKGGKGSGFHGHTGRPGQRGGSASGLVSESWGEYTVWRLGKGESLPKSELKKDALILLPPGGGAIVVTSPEGVEEMHTHAEIPTDLTTEEFDQSGRWSIVREESGKQVFEVGSNSVGLGRRALGDDVEEIDMLAERKIVSQARKIRGLGYSDKISVIWTTASWERESVITPLGEWKGRYRITLGELIEKGGEGSGFHGHQGRPGQRGGSASGTVSPVAHDRKAAAWEAELTPEKIAAVNRYVDYHYMEINGELREAQGRLGYIGNTEVRKDIRLIDSALKSAPVLDEDITLYRGIEEVTETPLAGLRAGEDFPSYGYMSTSISREKASGYTGSSGRMLVLNVPKGASGVGFIRGSHEVLLMRTTSESRFDRRLVVRDVTDDAVIVDWVPLSEKGGKGSGHFGHAGRPGQRGGSAEGPSLGRGMTDARKANVQGVLDVIPAGHLSAVKSIEFLTYDEMSTTYGGRIATALANCHGTAEGAEIALKIAPQGGSTFAGDLELPSQKAILAHEIGHAYHMRESPGDFDLPGESRSDLTAKVDKLYAERPAHTFSLVGESSAREYFAEAYAHYVVYPDVLRERAPAMYNLLRDEVFSSK